MRVIFKIDKVAIDTVQSVEWGPSIGMCREKMRLQYISPRAIIGQRVSMGLTDRRKTAKNLADSRKN